ncbi:helix-turn-helix domain-containing protein [Gilvimarinus agarilyticus]|uniref:helix-turn-helix domain-containing protein n=1 Tax=unclassified Gilvimarinus TaxID=2642066 RepID=UPI001C0A28C0|nr:MULTISPECIES: helix-turn-helix domain-containing protein [unclassified Gilvimarinus]MBU2884209.1 helix-turn-helix domain-containing protein [Gilvimarinus agarilyticus]MDO6569348.1 helix-turn-helix domain-containing protein [Gilvimarinus sp. 2_MG-2023]MDO6747502.1 helix-turn-helix domain-containing protein [Gilvimarinus sp. 1_MG-2023]
MNARKLRLVKGWSQEQLAEMAGVSIRTIQRIERGQPPSLETRNALAAVFEVDISEWPLEGIDMNTTSTATNETAINHEDSKAEALKEQKAMEYVRDVKAFYSNLASYLLIIPFLVFVNLTTSPGYIWVFWPAIGWGIGLALHALNVFEVFNFFGSDWERKQVEKRLGRKL